MKGITTHVLDTARGRPAAGVAVLLERRGGGGEEWGPIGHAETDANGRASGLMPATATLEPGVYRLTFDTQRYFDAQSVRTLYPEVVIVFEAEAGETHYHVPLLLGPFGYTTYRES
jgi:5-hydroxyisourate hydrolase